MLYYAAVCVLGVMAGGAFAWVWLRIVPPGTNRRFWSALSAAMREMLRVEETRAFIRLYGHLGKLLGPYLARNVGGTLLACLPVALILVFLAAPVFEAWDATAERVTLTPDVNPLRPFLSDIEAAFFAVFALSMGVAMLWPRRS